MSRNSNFTIINWILLPPDKGRVIVEKLNVLDRLGLPDPWPVIRVGSTPIAAGF